MLRGNATENFKRRTILPIDNVTLTRKRIHVFWANKIMFQHLKGFSLCLMIHMLVQKMDEVSVQKQLILQCLLFRAYSSPLELVGGSF